MSKYISKKIILTGLLIVLPAIAIATYASKKEETKEAVTTKKTVAVKTISASETTSVIENLEFPAIVKSDSEVTVLAKTSGTATRVNFNLGDKVSVGKLLAVVDDAGSSLDADESGFVNVQIQQAELGLKQAKESYDLAKDNYKDGKNLPSSQKDALKTQRDIAELQYQAAQLNVESLKDVHNIKSPFSGIITRKDISTGESVSAGQTIAIISRPETTNITFYVSAEELSDLKINDSVSVRNSDGETAKAAISHIGIGADEMTRRYPVEVAISKGEQTNFSLGSIVTIIVPIKKSPSREGNVILNLSSINIGQNGNAVFVVQDGKAAKIPVTLKKIEGEYAEVEGPFNPDSQIIIEGNKLVSDGQSVEISK